MPMARDSSSAPVQALKLSTPQQVAIGGASVQSTAIGANWVRLCATVACRIAIGSNPTAVAAGTYLPANVPEYFQCYPTDLVAVIQETGAGNLSITACG